MVAGDSDTGARVDQLSHPNVLRIYDMGTYDDPGSWGWFMVTELVEGQTLETWLREQTPNSDEILDVFEAAATGLAAAHASGIMHRDFKPDPEFPAEKDRADGEVSSDATPTLHGSIVGTPRYMAPEQLEGRGPLFEANNLFALQKWKRAGPQERPVGRRPPSRVAGRAARPGRVRTNLTPPRPSGRPDKGRNHIVRGLGHEHRGRYHRPDLNTRRFGASFWRPISARRAPLLCHRREDPTRETMSSRDIVSMQVMS